MPWRPTIPVQLVDVGLRRSRSKPAPQEGVPTRPLDFSVRAVERTRRQMRETTARMDPPPRALRRRTVQLPHCTAERFAMPGSRPDHVLLYTHGGAYLRGDSDTHAGMLSRVIKAARCEALSVDYRRAPEAQFPAWNDDALDGYKALLAEGIAPRNIVLGGDSAGGGIVLALIQRIAEAGLPQPAAAAVVSPWVDLTSSGPSHRENAHSDAMFWPHELPEAGAFLAREGGVEITNPQLSPAFADYPAGVPPLRIDVSTSELLRSDAELLADVYRRSGAPVELVMTPGMPHDWPVIGILAQGRRTGREIGAWLGAHLGA